MSESNVEVLRGLFAAYNTRDIEGFIACCDPGVKLETAFAAVGGEVYQGHDGLLTWHRDVEDVWGGAVHAELEAYFDLGEHTLAFYVLHGRGKHSGVEVGMPVALAVRWRDGLVVHMKAYAHREDALRDLGVSEGELERIEP
jgi:ketosteroid isomerase-like protein